MVTTNQDTPRIIIDFNQASTWDDVFRCYVYEKHSQYKMEPRNEFFYNRQECVLEYAKILNNIQEQTVDGKKITEWYEFENISLWQFVVGDLYSNCVEETFTFLYILDKIFQKYSDYHLELGAGFTSEKIKIAKKIASKYNINLRTNHTEFKNSIAITLKSNYIAIKCKLKNYIKKKLNNKINNLFSKNFHVKTICDKFRKNRNICDNGNSVLFVSFARNNKKTRDIYFSHFNKYFSARNYNCIRMDVPYYFQIQGNVDRYITWNCNNTVDEMDSVFLDEFLTEENLNKVRKNYRKLCYIYKKFLKNGALEKAFSYNGVSFFESIENEIQERCTTNLLVAMVYLFAARNALNRLCPKAILLVYEIGLYARTLIIEGHRLGIPTIGIDHGLQHAPIEYYLHSNLTNNPQLNKYCSSIVIPRHTALTSDATFDLFSNYYHYPKDSFSTLFSQQNLSFSEIKRSIDEIAYLKTKRKTGKKYVTFMTSGVSKELINYLIKLLNPSDHFIVFKPHPDDPYADGFYKILLDNNFEVIDMRNETSFKAILMADIVITPAYSTVTIEALFMRKKVISLLNKLLHTPWDEYVIDIENINDIALCIMPKTDEEIELLCKKLGFILYEENELQDKIDIFFKSKCKLNF